MRILIVEDERHLNETVSKYLRSQGYSTDSCYDGEEAIDFIDGAEYDAVLLDINLPGRDGLAVLRWMRSKKQNTPVLMLTARGAVEDKVAGLDMGADDYMTKPFSLEELSARLRVMIRRSSREQLDNVLKAGGLSLDTSTKAASLCGKEIRLTAKEYQILAYLMHNRGVVLSRDRIEQHIWNYDYEGSSNVIDVYIRNLRKKFEEAAPGETVIETVRGLGYVVR